MRLNKKTIKHTCLGCLHAIAICLPILACVFRLGYAWFNKNAKDSYSAEQSLNYSLIDTNTINKDSMYYFRTDNNLNQQMNLSYIPVNSINTITGSFTIPTNPTRFRIYYNNNNLSYSLQIEGDTTTYTLIGNTTNINVITFSFIANDDLSSNSYGSNIKLYEFSEQQTLDNAFYYSTKQTLKDFHYYSENMSSDYSTYVSNLQSYFVVNVDYLSLFGVNPSSDYLYYVAINFMLNYLVTIELVLLAPEILLVFFELIRKLMFGFLDKTDERSY